MLLSALKAAFGTIFLMVILSFSAQAKSQFSFPCQTDMDCQVFYDSRCHVPIGILKSYAKEQLAIQKADDKSYVQKPDYRTCEPSYEGEAYCSTFHECSIRAARKMPTTP